MKDIGRYRICEEIAKHFPYSVDTVYDVYTYVLEQNKNRGRVVMLDKQLQDVKTILQASANFHLSPMSVAYAVYQIDEPKT